MNSAWIVGALAFLTIGIVLVYSLGHLGNFLREPRNRDAAKNVARGGKSASTAAGEALPGTTTLKEWLDSSIASQHPDDPALKPHGTH